MISTAPRGSEEQTAHLYQMNDEAWCDAAELLDEPSLATQARQPESTSSNLPTYPSAEPIEVPTSSRARSSIPAEPTAALGIARPSSVPMLQHTSESTPPPDTLHRVAEALHRHEWFCLGAAQGTDEHPVEVVGAVPQEWKAHPKGQHRLLATASDDRRIGTWDDDAQGPLAVTRKEET